MGGDYKPPNESKQLRRSLQATTRYGPAAMAAFNAEQQREATGQAAQEFQLYNQYAQPYFNAGENLSDIGAQRGVNRDINTIAGGGSELARQATALDQGANPQWYANRQTAGQGFRDLIGGQDPNKLSGSEMANTERGLNRMNFNNGTPSSIQDATTTAANAMVFGDRLANKRAQFGQSLSLFPGIQQGSQSNVNAYQIAAGRGANSGTNASLGQYGAPNRFDANAASQGITQGAFDINQSNQNINAGRRSTFDYVTQGVGAAAGAAAAIGCCFIFLEAYNGTLPTSVRICRDFYYQRNPLLARGYKKMARWLVPAMRRYRLVRWLVNICMVQPITRYGEWLTGESFRYNTIDKMIKNTWFTIWSNYAI